MYDRRAKPTAFADEQLDADLWQILGSWEQLQPQAQQGNTRPSTRILIKAQQEHVANVDGDGTLSAAEIRGSQIAPYSVRASLAQQIGGRRPTIGITFVVAVGAGLVALIMGISNQQRPTKAQANSDNKASSTNARAQTGPTHTVRTAKSEPNPTFNFTISKPLSTKVGGRTTHRQILMKKHDNKRDQDGDLATTNVTKTNVAVRYLSPNDSSSKIVLLDTSETTKYVTPLEDRGDGTPSTNITDDKESVLARRNSVQALRSLRRQ
ncbi:MAG: hypothetical protein EOO38_16145 [Cytophagaceae bacterium]|nr:MAG: hypothetical protein EOO38_16145 [Cytophagaceae bacterium]